jgi:hypothetical protein
MTSVATIAEGDGEFAAVPVLLRRLNEHFAPGTYVQLPTPIRVYRDRFLNRDEEFRRHLLLAAGKCGADGWILILLDADDDCPAELGRKLRRAPRSWCRIGACRSYWRTESTKLGSLRRLHRSMGTAVSSSMLRKRPKRNVRVMPKDGSPSA